MWSHSAGGSKHNAPPDPSWGLGRPPGEEPGNGGLGAFGTPPPWALTHLQVPETPGVCTGPRRHTEKSLPAWLYSQKYLLPHKGGSGRGENQASEKENYLNIFRRDL